MSSLLGARRDPARSVRVRTDLRGADLSGADLRGAVLEDCLLEGAGLVGARFDAATRWPSGFDPAAAGAIAVPQP